MAGKRTPVVFISYSHRDRKIKDRLAAHIRILGDTTFELWEDSRIRTGENWRKRIWDGLSRADAGVLLISTDFLTSNFIKTVELPVLLTKPVYPVLIGYCAWENVEWLKKLQVRTDNGEPLGTRGRKLDKGLVEVAREMAPLYGAKRARRERPAAPARKVAPRLREGRVSRVRMELPEGSLVIVVGMGRRTGPVFNLLCQIVNESGAPETIQRLDIKLTDPHGSSFILKWHLFYRGLEQGYAQTLTIPAKSRQSEGIQFVGPKSIANYQWSEGEYSCEFRARLAASRLDAVLARYSIQVTAGNAKDLNYWGRAKKAQWNAMNFSDNAVGIPVGVSRRLPSS